MRHTPALLLFLTLSAGCASAPSAEDGGQSSLPVDYEGKIPQGKAEGGEGQATPARRVEPLAGGEPYAERPGADEGDKNAELPRVVQFEPPRSPRPVARSRRPKLPSRVSVGVVLVREDGLAHEPELLLELDEHLRDDMSIRSLVALRTPSQPKVSLEDLARQGQGAGRDLVLIDVCPGLNGAVWTGYLVHAASGRLLAYYEEFEEGSQPVSTGKNDLAERLGNALAKLKGR